MRMWTAVPRMVAIVTFLSLAQEDSSVCWFSVAEQQQMTTSLVAEDKHKHYLTVSWSGPRLSLAGSAAQGLTGWEAWVLAGPLSDETWGLPSGSLVVSRV